MKIIGRSNFDNPRVNDILVCENIGLTYGNLFVSHLNMHFNTHGRTSTYYYAIVEDNYELYEFKP
jgi:hypothetical protein